MKKLMCLFLAVVLMLAITPVLAKGNDKVEDKLNYYHRDVEELVTEKISVLGRTEDLYIEFADQSGALARFKQALPVFIAAVTAETGVELTEETWEEFFLATNKFMNERIEDEAAYCKYSNQYAIIQSFFDIFENKYKNDALKTLVLGRTASEIDKAELAFLLPNSNSFLPEVRREINRSRTANYNVNAAVSYAIARVYAPNITEYGYSSSDCTNFVSQVIKAGGVAEVGENSGISNYGWWHKKNSSGGNVYSNSWIWANTFVEYFGPSYMNTSFYGFSYNARRGDVIALDSDADYDWDHCGYVTDVQAYNSSLGYCDLFIAQHSTNYHLWTSNINCGWNLNLGTKRFAIIHWQDL